MAESHSEKKGKHLLVISAQTYYPVYPDGHQGTLIELDIPSDFDFKKRGNELLRNIESATNLFFKSGETNEGNDDDSGGDSDFGSPTKHRR